MTEPRPHRPPVDSDKAARELRAEASAGRLDGEAVDAVLRTHGGFTSLYGAWKACLPQYGLLSAATNRVGNTNQYSQDAKVIRPESRMLCFICCLVAAGVYLAHWGWRAGWRYGLALAVIWGLAVFSMSLGFLGLLD